MLINSTQELRELTGNYYANNDYSKIAGDIELATEELAGIVGEGVIRLAEEQLENAGNNETLLRKVQRPIALLATLRMYQKNDLSHEDDGRKFKVSTDNGEKLPWEWQLDRDDALHLEEYYRAVDALIRFLNKTKEKVWTDSEQYRQSKGLIIRSGAELNRYFPIDRSERMYLLLVPFIREAQRMKVIRAYGTGWENLLAETDNGTADESTAHYAACMATALYAFATALRRLPLRVFPSGVIRGYIAKNGIASSQAATLDDVVRAAEWMEDDATVYLDDMKRARDGSMAEYSFLPQNHHKNKYCRV